MSAPAAAKAYRLDLDGFTGQFSSIAELKAHVAELKKRYRRLVGQTATIVPGFAVGIGGFAPSADPVFVVVSP